MNIYIYLYIYIYSYIFIYTSWTAMKCWTKLSSVHFYFGNNYGHKVIIRMLHCDQRFTSECVSEFTWKETYIFLFEETKKKGNVW